MGLVALGTTLIVAVIAGLLRSEIEAWSPWVATRLFNSAVAMLPKSSRDRFQEEWAAYIQEVPGPIGKICAASGFIVAAILICLEATSFSTIKIVFLAQAYSDAPSESWARIYSKNQGIDVNKHDVLLDTGEKSGPDYQTFMVGQWSFHRSVFGRQSRMTSFTLVGARINVPNATVSIIGLHINRKKIGHLIGRSELTVKSKFWK